MVNNPSPVAAVDNTTITSSAPPAAAVITIDAATLSVIGIAIGGVLFIALVVGFLFLGVRFCYKTRNVPDTYNDLRDETELKPTDAGNIALDDQEYDSFETDEEEKKPAFVTLPRKPDVNSPFPPRYTDTQTLADDLEAAKAEYDARVMAAVPLSSGKGKKRE